MSSFLSFGSMMPGTLRATDERIRAGVDQWNTTGRSAQLAPWADAQLWPMSRMMCGDPNAPVSLFGTDSSDFARWGAMPDEGGSQSMLKFRGVTRNSSGVALGGGVVGVFLTSTNLALRQVTADASGYFEVPSEYANVNHYLVGYKPGTPDVAGTTLNTLQPT